MLSAVLDKSVFQRVCQTKDSPLWQGLTTRYRLVIPTILVEETFVNVWDPKTKTASEVHEMKAQLMRLQSHWIEDIRELAFQELVLGQKTSTPPSATGEFLAR